MWRFFVCADVTFFCVCRCVWYIYSCWIHAVFCSLCKRVELVGCCDFVRFVQVCVCSMLVEQWLFVFAWSKRGLWVLVYFCYVLAVMLAICLLWVSLGSRMRPNVLGSVFMSSIVLLICRYNLALYSAGSDVKNIHVICPSWVWGCLTWSTCGCCVDMMVVCFCYIHVYVSVYCSNWYIVYIGYELCLFGSSRYVWGVYVEECGWKDASLSKAVFNWCGVEVIFLNVA